jgi:hypothetical protein
MYSGLICRKGRGLSPRWFGFSRTLNYFPIEKVMDLIYGAWTTWAAGPSWTLVLGAVADDIGPSEFGQISTVACQSSLGGVWKREGHGGILTSYQGRRQSGYPSWAMKLKVVARAHSTRPCFGAPLVAATA